jgi:hypothetical protein
MLATPLRVAARDSALVAVLGRLGPDDLRLLADAQPRARSVQALALLLDVDSWAEPMGEPIDSPDEPLGGTEGRPGSAVEASAALLRGAGWRVAIVRRGMATAQVWRLLLAGAPYATAAGLR